MRKIQSHDLEAATNVRKVRHEVDSDVTRMFLGVVIGLF